MEPQENPKDQPLTREDIQRLESMFHQTAQEMYVILHEIEQGLWVMAHATKEYKAYQKAHGKAAAEAMLSQTVHDQLFNHDEMYNVGIILRKIGELKPWLDRLFNVGIEVNKSVPDAGKKEWEMAEALLHDGKLLAWRHAMMCGINPADDIKLDSTLKALAKDRTISARILDRLKANSEIV
jgi:hypothetical protein